jgi:hypothetical protein
MADTDLTFKLKIDGTTQARDELGRFTKAVRDDVTATEAAIQKTSAGAYLSVAEQIKAVDSLQRQRSSAILSSMRAMEGDLGRSATLANQTTGLTDKLIADSQLAIAQAERSAATAALSIERVGGRLATAEQEAAGFTSQLSAIATVALPVGVALAAVGAAAVAVVAKAEQVGNKFADLSAQTGLSVATLSGLELTLKQNRASLETLANSMFFLERNMGKAKDTGGSMAAAFKRLGVDITAGPEVAFRQLVAGLAKIPDLATRNELGAQVMGRGYRQLSLFINNTNGDIDGIIAKARAAGLVMSGEAVRGADELRDHIEAVSLAAERFEFRVGNALIPEINRLARAFHDGQIEGDLFSVVFDDLAQRTHQFVDIILVATAAIGAYYAAMADTSFSEAFEKNLSLLLKAANTKPAEKGRFASASGEFASPGGEGEGGIIRVDESGQRATGTKGKGETAGLKSAVDAWEKEQEKAKELAERARNTLQTADASAAQAAFKQAVDEAERLYKITGDYVAFVERMKTAERDRWAARKTQLQDERLAIVSRNKDINDPATGLGTTKEETAQEAALRVAEVKVKNNQLIAEQADFNLRMEKLNEELTTKSLATLQKEHREKLEIWDLQATEFIDKQKQMAQAGEISFAEAQKRITAEQASGLNQRREFLEEEKKAAIGNADAVADYIHQLSVLTEKAEAFKREAGGAATSATIQDLERLEKDIGDVNAALDRMIESRDGLPGVNLGRVPQGVGQTNGPVVSPGDIAALGAPPPPNFDPWKGAIAGLKDVALNSFHAMAQGFGQMIQQWVLTGSLGEHALRKLTATVLSNVAMQAATQALMFTAYGIAALTPWGAAIYGPATQWFEAAALMGAVALGTGLLGRAVAGNAFNSSGAVSAAGGASTGSAFGSPAQGSGTIEQSRNLFTPRPIIIHQEPVQVEVTMNTKSDPGTFVEMVGTAIKGHGEALVRVFHREYSLDNPHLLEVLQGGSLR